VLATQAAGFTDPRKVRDALARLDTDSFFGRIRFDASGKNVSKPMSVIQIQGGKVVTVWPVAPGVKPLRWPTPPFNRR
jgi:branched-chain amino acid transport system substrate-binding protein